MFGLVTLLTAVDVSESVGQSHPTFDAMTQTDNASDIQHTVDQTSNMYCDRSHAQTQVRSRFGRLIKPVNRLIQTMSRQDVVQNKFNVGAVCDSVF